MQTLMNRNGAIIQLLQSGFLLGSRTIFTTGSNSYTPPAGCKTLFVELLSGGGGGATTVNSSAGQITMGSGGSGGAYTGCVVSLPLALVQDGATTPFTATVGAGGTIAAGGSSIFQSNLVAGTAVGTIGAFSTNSAAGTVMATGSTELFIIGAGTGNSSNQGDYGTPSGNAGGNGHRVSGTVGISGRGAAGPFGCGQPGGRTTQGAGATGKNYGAGGSGGLSTNAGGTAANGGGSKGLIIIWEFF